MGISSSSLSENSALVVVGGFLITNASFNYAWGSNMEGKAHAVKLMVLGAVMCDLGKRLNTIK